MHNHNDPTQTSFYIPYEPQDEEPEETWVSAYRISWSKCLTQLQAEIDSLYTPTIDSVLHRLSTVHEDVLPGLPYPELPFIAVHNSSSRFINILLTRLHTNDIRVSHLYPSDEPNISTAMRTLISNLLTARKAKTSRHATYDITLLNEHFTRSDPLLIVLHDFEQFEPSVIQDLLYICSTRLSSLHLTFLVFLSSPPATQGQGSSYIHNTYPRSTLTHLRIHSFSVPCGQPVLEQTLLGTFFNPSFYPGIILGPKVLEGITDYYTRHNGSVDALITGVQLVYLKHFFTEPLSVLTHPPAPLAYDDHILNLLRSRLPAYPDDEDVLELFQRHSISFQSASCDLRLGFTLLHTTMIFLGSKGYKPFPSFSPATSLTMTLMLSVLKGQTTREIKTLTMYMKKLQPQSLERLLESLFENIPLSGYDETRKALRRFITQEDEIDAGEVSVWFSEMLTSLFKPLSRSSPIWDTWYTSSSPFPSELLNPAPRATILSALLRPHSFTLPLPLANPHHNTTRIREGSPTVSEIEQQLSSTHLPSSSSAQRAVPEAGEQGKEAELHHLPDTSILFARYLDSGKLINIFDWYESFKVYLDAQRVERVAALNSRKSPRKGAGRGHGPGRGRSNKKSGTSSPTKGQGKPRNDNDEGAGDDVEMTDEQNEEDWQKEVQARFMRALHELDYLGFIKHTGRRIEHVARVVFDLGDEDDQGEEEED